MHVCLPESLLRSSTLSEDSPLWLLALVGRGILNLVSSRDFLELFLVVYLPFQGASFPEDGLFQPQRKAFHKQPEHEFWADLAPYHYDCCENSSHCLLLLHPCFLFLGSLRLVILASSSDPPHGLSKNKLIVKGFGMIWISNTTLQLNLNTFYLFFHNFIYA